MKKTQVFFWVGKFGEGEKIFPIKRDPEDRLPSVSMKFSLIASSQTHIQQLADLQLPWRSRRKWLLLTYLYEGLGMKYFHSRWVPNTLIDPQKAHRVRYAQEMIQSLNNHSRTGSKYIDRQ
jgi:hypothetical protein